MSISNLQLDRVYIGMQSPCPLQKNMRALGGTSELYARQEEQILNETNAVFSHVLKVFYYP